MTENTSTAATAIETVGCDKSIGSRAAQALEARKAAYDTVVCRALPFIKKAEEDMRIYKAKTVASVLNFFDVPAPSGKEWSPRSVLRALHRLKELNLHAGPPPCHRVRWHAQDPWLKTGGTVRARKAGITGYAKIRTHL